MCSYNVKFYCFEQRLNLTNAMIPELQHLPLCKSRQCYLQGIESTTATMFLSIYLNKNKKINFIGHLNISIMFLIFLPMLDRYIKGGKSVAGQLCTTGRIYVLH